MPPCLHRGTFEGFENSLISSLSFQHIRCDHVCVKLNDILILSEKKELINYENIFIKIWDYLKKLKFEITERSTDN